MVNIRGNILLSVFVTLLLTCCGVNHSGENFSGVLSTDFGPAPAATSKGSGGVSASPTPGGSGSGGNSSSNFTTTTGGYFTVDNVITTSLLSSETLRGVTSDGGIIYALIRKNLGSGIIRWYINSSTISATTWTPVCDMLDDTNFNGGLAHSTSKFYTFGSISQGGGTTDIRIFDRITCAEQTKVTIPSAADIGNAVYGFPASLGYVTGTLFFVSYYGFSTPNGVQNGVRGFDVATTSFNSCLSSATIGGKTFGWSEGEGQGYFSPKAFGTAQLWALNPDVAGGNYAGQVPPLLWKFQLDGSPVGWGELPATTYPYLGKDSGGKPYTKFLTIFDSSQLVVATTHSDAFRLYFLGVTHF
ncbi:hypothetical protein WDW86_05620 [Bdellovibrionota bacterium FG-2]